MKKFLFLSTIFLILPSCSLSKKPEFERISKIDVKNVSMRNITIHADAVFNNPNNVDGTLSIEDMHVFVDNIDVGVISSKEFDVPSKNEFKIPLEGTFSLSKIYEDNKSNLLNSVLKIVQTDSIHIQYKGNIKYHFGNFSYPYKINKEQKVSLK
ncbi:LEA type 2 family protein [Aquimarina sp. 433]